jgi:hypothetical protein
MMYLLICILLEFEKNNNNKNLKKNQYFKGESGETKSSIVILVLILVSCFFQNDMIDSPIHVLFKCNKVNKIQKRSIYM